MGGSSGPSGRKRLHRVSEERHVRVKRVTMWDAARGERGSARARGAAARPTRAWVGVRVFSYATDGDAKNCVVPSIVGKASEPETRVEGETHPSSPMRPAPMVHASLFPARRRVGERARLRTVTDGCPVDQHALARTSRRVLGSREACARALSRRLEITWRDDRAVDATAFTRTSWTIRARCNAA